MSRFRLGFLLIVVLGLPVLPGSATAQQVVPPGNSSVNQYTETIPTSEGGAPAPGKRGQAPSRILGDRNAQELEAMGAEGRAAAALAAATAPASTRGEPALGRAPAEGGGRVVSPRESSSGASGSGDGLIDVIGQATGSSTSGSMGLLFPLTVAAILLWSLAYLWRRLRSD